jgi:hypothetical protein
MLGRIVMVGVATTLLGACSIEHRTVAGEDACASYGLRVGSPEYDKCRARGGRAGSAYTSAELMTASRLACQSYGIQPYTESFERCARNEYAWRSQG